MKKRLFCFLLAFGTLSATADEAPRHVPSLLPPEKSFKLVWQDEFVVDFVRVYDIVK